jgi:hypothetical protein
MKSTPISILFYNSIEETAAAAVRRIIGGALLLLLVCLGYLYFFEAWVVLKNDLPAEMTNVRIRVAGRSGIFGNRSSFGFDPYLSWPGNPGHPGEARTSIANYVGINGMADTPVGHDKKDFFSPPFVN